MTTNKESTADEFGEKIAEALRDKAAWRHLPRSFAARFAAGAERRQVPPRLKAAAIWLALSLGALAATIVGRAVLTADDGQEEAAENATAFSTKEQGEDNMIMARKVAAKPASCAKRAKNTSFKKMRSIALATGMTASAF